MPYSPEEIEKICQWAGQAISGLMSQSFFIQK
jgi:hypothetical protein